MTEAVKVQATLAFSDINITLRFDTVPDLIEAFKEVAKSSDELSSSLAEIKQAYIGKSVMTGTNTPPSQPSAASSQRSTPPPTNASPSEGRSCKHGDRVRKTGQKGNNTWVGWFCPTAKGDPDQCKAEFEN